MAGGHAQAIGSVEDLTSHLYPNCLLRILPGRGPARLTPFEWRDGQLVCIPQEMAEDFRSLMAEH